MFERELILSRISEGRKRARRNGIKFGRKPKLTAYQRQEALERLAEGEKAPLPEASMSVAQRSQDWLGGEPPLIATADMLNRRGITRASGKHAMQVHRLRARLSL